MTTAVLLLLLLLVVVLLLVNHRLRQSRRALQYELDRVLRAGAGRVHVLESEASWLRKLSEIVESPLVVTDTQQRLLYANPAAEARFGSVTTGEGLIERLRHHRVEEMITETLEEGYAVPRMADVQNRLFHVQTQLWRAPDGQPGGVVVLMEDMTDLHYLSRARRDMVANLSHELRTPLASVKLMTETLLRGAMAEPEITEQFIRRIARENDALIRLLEDLTALSWIESGRTALRLEQVDLRAFVATRLERLAPQQAAQEVRFALEGPTGALVAIDPERFGQVLTNLLDNALKFSPPGGTIHVTIERGEMATTLAVRDEGPGILPSDLPRIFERFYKGNRARTRSEKEGTGLGLAIAKHLVEAHGGTIAAANNPHRGAVFTVTLPHS